jgi:hypothetical protein
MEMSDTSFTMPPWCRRILPVFTPQLTLALTGAPYIAQDDGGETYVFAARPTYLPNEGYWDVPIDPHDDHPLMIRIDDPYVNWGDWSDPDPATRLLSHEDAQRAWPGLFARVARCPAADSAMPDLALLRILL